MKKILEDLFHAGLGITAVTKEQVEKIFNELKDRGEVQEKEKDLFITKFLEKLEETGSAVGEKIKKTLSPNAEKFDELSRKIDTLLKEIEKMKRAGKEK